MSPVVVWTTIIGSVLIVAYYVSRLAKVSADDGRGDIGMAIIEFGRAYPDEAIRSLHTTADGKAIFVRLHDNKAGLMRDGSRHYVCHLIQPGRVRVQPLTNPKGFSAQFLDAPSQNGEFVFATEKEAAEVSLWLLDNYVSVADRSLEAEPDIRAEPKPEQAS